MTNTPTWNKKILLVDDNPVLSRTFSTLLQQYGCDVVWVPTAQQATAALQIHSTHLWGALVDLSIVKLEGIEWFRSLEQQFTSRRLALWSGACPDRVEMAVYGIRVDSHLLRKPPTDMEIQNWLRD